MFSSSSKNLKGFDAMLAKYIGKSKNKKKKNYCDFPFTLVFQFRFARDLVYGIAPEAKDLQCFRVTMAYVDYVLTTGSQGSADVTQPPPILQPEIFGKFQSAKLFSLKWI